MGRRRAATGVSAIALALALPLAIACEQALSIDGPVTIAPHEACGLPVNPGTCQTCVAAHCCTQATACANDMDCAAYESCLLDCGSDYACRTACATKTGGGIGAEVPLIDQCIATSCNDACGMVCGIPAAPSEPEAAVGCASCISDKACQPSLDCAKSPTCEQVGHCLVQCTAPDCRNACLAQDDGGLFVGAEFAVASVCVKPCELGNLWSCVGGVSWPFAPAGAADVTFTLSDSTTHAALAGLVGAACDRPDEQCSSPIATGTTDKNGRVTLTLPPYGARTYGFQGYFDATLSAGYHELYFLTAPLTQTHAQFSEGLLSQTGLHNLASSAGIQLDPTRGHLAVQVQDCLGAPGSAVTFEVNGIDGPTKVVYLAGGVLLTSATETDITGYVFILNAPPGKTISVDAFPKALGNVVASHVTAFVRAGSLSVVQAIPTP